MRLKNIFLVISAVLLHITSTQCSVLLWSRKGIEISPLRSFNDVDLENLINDLQPFRTIFYKSSPEILSVRLQKMLNGFHTVYLPNGIFSSVESKNISEISNDNLSYLLEKQSTASDNDLFVLLIEEKQRAKRESILSSTETPINNYQIPKGPVLYRGKSIKDSTYALMYSSKPLQLKMNGSTIFLGSTSKDMINVDTKSRDSFTRLNVNVPLEEGGKITLRFIFSWLGGYWGFTTVKITDNNNNLSYNLTMVPEVKIPASFSYHCGGETKFIDAVNNVELFLYNMQFQVDSSSGKFGDAYDCVNFMTGPIWSGLFVTFLLGVGLVVALVAIGDIKTMDKFDNHKTKQLAITVRD